MAAEMRMLSVELFLRVPVLVAVVVFTVDSLWWVSLADISTLVHGSDKCKP
jgi:hypothetical protein